MSLTTPVLLSISPFDKINSHSFEFQIYGGDQVTANTLLIEKVDDNVEVYNQKIETFQYLHQLPDNILTNGIQYRAKIQTHDINNNSSLFSDSILFYCFSTPTVTVPTLSSGIVNNSSVELQGSYTQSEGEIIESYRFYLYDLNSKLIAASTEKYGEPITHTFSALQDNQHCKAELKVYTVNGMVASSGLIDFDVNYISPIFNTAIELENISDQASVKINAHIIDLVAEVGNGTPTYELDDWVNLKDSSIYFQDNFNIKNDFTLKFWCKDITENEILIELIGINDNSITIKYLNNKFHVYKTTDNKSSYYIYSNDITFTSTDTICVQLQQIGDLLNIQSQVVI